MSVYTQTESSTGTSGNAAHERSLGELISDLTKDTTQLVRQEINLAKTEITQKATKVGKDVGMIAVGGVVAYVGLLALVAAIVCGLVAVGLAAWVAALIVGLVFGIGGGLVAFQGLSALKRVDPMPRQTMESLKEDAEWAKARK